MKLTSLFKILSRLSKPEIATQKYKKIKSAKFKIINLIFNSASTVSIDGYYKTLLDIIHCQISGVRRKLVILILVEIKKFRPNRQDLGEFTLA